jgi:energy-coupling factor transporter transmembrane protein EcfT
VSTTSPDQLSHGHHHGHDVGERLYIHKHSVVHALASHLKILTVLSFILVVVATEITNWLAFIGYFLLILSAVLVAKINLLTVFKRALIEIPFVFFAILIPFFGTGAVIEVGPLKLYEAGLINQHSIGFSTIKESKIEGKSAKDSYYQIQEVKLYEFSSVLWGANPDTPFMGMKALDAKGLQERFDKLYKQLKSGNLMDETYELLEIEYNFIKSELFKLINEREKSEEPTPIIIDPVEEERKKSVEFLLILKENLNK